MQLYNLVIIYRNSVYSDNTFTRASYEGQTGLTENALAYQNIK